MKGNAYMDEIGLRTPSMEYADQIMQFRMEMIAANDSLSGCGSLDECSTAEQWLKDLDAMKDEATCPKGFTTSSTYLAVRISDDKVVGIIDLRHNIDSPVLKLWGGHMGYCVRPCERRRGYAKEMLRLNLKNCRDRNMKSIMITCASDNIASEKTILANGGVFEKAVAVDGQVYNRYWIDCWERNH